MDKLKQKLRKNGENSRQTVSKSLVVGSIIATLIAATPYLFYLYESVPNTKVWNTFLFSYDSRFWEDANYAMWIFTSKAIPLLLLFIWFFTNRHWWYHVLLVPIVMYLYQIFSLFNDETQYIDQFQLIYLIPVMAIIIPSIYLIRARMFNRLTEKDKSMEELEEEFKIKPKSFIERLSDYF